MRMVMLGDEERPVYLDPTEVVCFQWDSDTEETHIKLRNGFNLFVPNDVHEVALLIGARKKRPLAGGI